MTAQCGVRILSGRLISITIVATATLAFVSCSEQDAPPTNNPALSCTITGESICTLGTAPKLQVQIVNHANHPIFLVGSLDGSESKMRYPHCYFEVIGPDGKSANRDVIRCGNTNPLREKEFVTVPGGGTFNPYQLTDEVAFYGPIDLSPDTFRVAGEYRVRFFYSTDSADLNEWLGDGPIMTSQHLTWLVNAVPKATISSDEFVVSVVTADK